MAGITLEQAQAQLQMWLDADAAVAKNQSYSIGGRTLERANAYQIRENIKYWTSWVERLSARPSGRVRLQVGIPL